MIEYYKIKAKDKIIVSFIYIILVFAVFSDVLRIPDTSITFFRMSLPLSLIIIAMYQSYARWLVGLTIGLGVITLGQYWIFYSIEEPELTFYIVNLVQFFILYILLFVVFILVKFLKDREKSGAEKKLLEFIIYIGFISMLVTLLDTIDMKYWGSQFFGALEADNQNNYGCNIAAVFPFFLVEFQEKRRLRDVLGMVAAFAVLYINDSKAALFGIVISTVVFVCIAFPADTIKKMLIYRYLIIICAVIAVVGLLIINPAINGYSLQDTIYQPIIRVITNHPYPDAASSIAFRTNTTLYAIRKLVSTGFLGVGIGNTGVLLKHDFPPEILADGMGATSTTRLSLHNSWLEFALDIGIIAVIIFIMVLKYVLQLYFTKKTLSTMEKLRVMFVISFPVWILSTSGFYTLYYVMIVMGYLLFEGKKGNGIER